MQNMTINRSGKWLQNACESAAFVWTDGELYYLYVERDVQDRISKRMKIVRFSDGALISTFGEGYGYADVIVEGSTLHIFCTNAKNGEVPPNSIFKFTTTDLTTFSGPTLVYTPEADGSNGAYVPNVSVCKNTDTGTYVLSYDVHHAGWYAEYWVTRFLQSSDLSTWTPIGDATYAMRAGGACELHYIDGKYYMWFNDSTTTPGKVYTRLVRTSTFNSFEISRLMTLKPTFEFEDINTSDPSIIEYNGMVYIFYCVCDQATYMRLTYATFDGTLKNFKDAYWQLQV